MSETLRFTLAFEGDIRKANANPLTTETPFGTAYAAGIGDQFELADIYLAALEDILDAAPPLSIAEIAQKAVDAGNAHHQAQIKAAKQ